MMRDALQDKPADAGRVLMDLAAGETVAIGEGITVKVVAKSGRSARLCIVAPRAIPIVKSGAESASALNLAPNME